MFPPADKAVCAQCGTKLIVTPENYFTCPNIGHIGLVHPQDLFLAASFPTDRERLRDKVRFP